MKTIKISYTTNKQIWKIERTAAEPHRAPKQPRPIK